MDKKKKEHINIQKFNKKLNTIRLDIMYATSLLFRFMQSPSHKSTLELLKEYLDTYREQKSMAYGIYQLWMQDYMDTHTVIGLDQLMI
jgi:hypothetical protein